MDPAPEVVALGHAIVDVLAPSPDALVEDLGLEKGTMTLVEEDRADRIYSALGPTTEASGGSAANTAACLSSFGARVEFVGKVRDDALGRVFAHDIRAAGVGFQVEMAGSGPGTGRCLVLITPDAEKTMCTHLGIGALVDPSDVDVPALRSAEVLYVEGYLCGKPESDPAVGVAVRTAKECGARVALSGSDPAWVRLHGDALRSLLDSVDLLFVNEDEALGLAGTPDLAAAVDLLGRRCATVAVTLGPKGCVVADSGRVVSVPAAPAGAVVDTTGAGDSFAAGFLFGFVRGEDPVVSARLGSVAAAEMVSHIGARPLRSLAELAARAGLLGHDRS